MAKDPSILQIELMFQGLNTEAAANYFPEVSALSNELNRLVDLTREDYIISVNNQVVKKFATAAVEMWHRCIHSFLVSTSLTVTSPLWSSVTGYYSSHYCIRAFAHLLGHFQMYKGRRIVELQIRGSSYSCNVTKKNGGDREHKIAWKIVKAYPLFSTDPFFTLNNDSLPESDGAHRNKANYADHIGRFPNFHPLDENYLRKRISQIANMEFSTAPIPNANKYPDLESVQVIAYHRLVRFRMFLDEILSNSNRFWRVNRNPNWATGYLNYQMVKPEYTTLYQGRV